MKINYILCKELSLLGILATITILLRGYYYRTTFMLPYTYKYLDPTLFTKDIAFFNYNLNFFFYLNAYLSKLFSFESIFFFGYIISSFILILGIYYLAKTLFKNNNVAYLSVILLIFPKPLLGPGSTSTPYFYYTDIAIGLILISFTFFLRKQYIYSSIILGVASLFQVLYSLYFVGFYGIYFLVNFLKMKSKEIQKRLLSLFVLLLFVSAPVYLILFSEEQQPIQPESFQSWLSILKLRSFDHFFPSTWVANHLILFIPLFVLIVLFLSYLYYNKKENVKEYRRPIYLFTVFSAILCLAGVVFSEIIPVRFLIISQLFRITIFLTFFAVMFGSYIIYRFFKSYYNQCKVIYGLIAFCLFVILFYYKSLLTFNPFMYISILLAGLFVLLIPHLKRLKVSPKLLAVLFLSSFLAISFIYAISQSSTRSNDPCPEPISNFNLQEHIQYPDFPKTYFYNVSIWAKENTPKESLFMMPVQCGGFRNWAQRSVFVDFKYGTMSTFSVDFSLHWFERIEDLNPEREYSYKTFLKDIITDYRNLSQERIEELVQKYEINYGIFEKPKELDFPLVYENREYIVYKLN